MQRPIGLKIIVLLNISRGVLGLLAGILMLWFRFLGTTFDIVVIIFSLVAVILGIGLWRMRNWARWASIILVLGGLLTQIAIAVSLPSLFGLSWRHMNLEIAENAIDVWTVIYLFTSKVRCLFLSPDMPGLERS
jgi:hypothetical protein